MVSLANKEKRINAFIDFARSYDVSLEVLDRNIELGSVQVKVTKKFSLLWFLVLLGLIYVIYYFATKDQKAVMYFDED